jgi:hypothetical protein
LFGLLGVVIGGLITAGSNYLLDRRREFATRQSDERSQAVEIKRAARLIDVEILRAAAAVKIVLESRRWPNASLTTDAFKKYGGLLAPVLPYQDWLTLVKAVLAIDSVEWKELTQSGISDDLADAITPVSDDLMAAVNVLNRWCDR